MDWYSRSLGGETISNSFFNLQTTISKEEENDIVLKTNSGKINEK